MVEVLALLQRKMVTCIVFYCCSLFTLKKLIEFLLSTRHYVKHWGFNGPCPCGASSLVGKHLAMSPHWSVFHTNSGLYLSTIDVLNLIILSCGGGAMPSTMFRSISGFYPLDASNIFPKISRQPKVSPDMVTYSLWGQTLPSWELMPFSQLLFAWWL